MNKTKLILFTIVSLIVIDSLRWINSMEGSINFSSATYIASILIYISIAIYIYNANNDGFGNKTIPTAIKNLFKLFLIWNIFSLIRGAFLSNDYWDWKFLFFDSISFSLIPLAFFFGKNLFITKIIFKFVINYLFPFGFVLIPLAWITNPELYSRIMIPVSLFILFIPFVKYKWKVLILVVAVTSILVVIDFRSNIIKIAFSTCLLIVYYFRSYIHQNWLRLAHISLFAFPIVLFTLAVTDKYNIFAETSQNDNYEVINEEGEVESLTADTRTFIYEEVLSSLNNSGHILFGEGATGKYQSDVFDYLGDNRGRYGSEVGILNILLYNGMVGVLLYFLLLFTVSLIAINRSNNTLAKMLGLFIAFRWTYSFVEEFTNYDLNFYFFWITVGLASLASFRSMNDNEIINFLKLQ